MAPDGASKSPTPEDRLLELIRKSETGPSFEAPRASVMPGQGGKVVLSGLAEKSRQDRRRYSLPVLWILGGVALIEVLLMVVLALRPMPSVDIQVPAAAAEAEPLPELAAAPKLTDAVKRTLFVPPPQPVVVKQDEGKKIAETAEKLRARLTIKGIIAGNPSQAIIEDSETGRTIFASPGDRLMEGAVVDSVTESKTVISIETETITLNL